MNAIEYAVLELKKYSLKVFGRDISKTIEIRSENKFDDGYVLTLNNGGNGLIKASNERSVLFAVYKIFELAGCRFIMPGKFGEYICARNIDDFSASYTFIPSYAHRGVTIEGAVSREQALEFIEWMPKVGLNSYFVQFRAGYEFFDRWYTHSNNPLLKKEEFNDEICESVNEELACELKRRNLLFHKVGHGWTCEALGISSRGWYKTDDCSEDTRKLLAETNGARCFFKSTPLNTHLCYSNEKAKELLVAEVVDYAVKNQEVDYLHFWLADDANNICECEACRDTLLADYYVEICNRIDAKLTELNIETKIVFLVYLELYWVPKKQRFFNEQRFTLMFAPIFRSYSHTLLNGGFSEKRLEYALNKNKFPSDTATYLTFLKDWQMLFNGDGFDFDYHLMWDIYRDFSSLKLAKILHKDICDLKAFGLNGLLSCQVQRAFMPTALGMTVLTKTLSDSSKTFEKIKADYFADCFSQHAELVTEIFESIEQNVDYEYLRSEKPIDDKNALDGFRLETKKLSGYLEKLKAIDLNGLDEFFKFNLECVIFWVEMLSKLLPCFIVKGEGQTDEALKKYTQVHEYICRNELKFVNQLDCYYFNFINKGFLECGGKVNHGGI